MLSSQFFMSKNKNGLIEGLKAVKFQENIFCNLFF